LTPMRQSGFAVCPSHGLLMTDRYVLCILDQRVALMCHVCHSEMVDRHQRAMLEWMDMMAAGGHRWECGGKMMAVDGVRRPVGHFGTE
jgi:hypothetical protein